MGAGRAKAKMKRSEHLLFDTFINYTEGVTILVQDSLSVNIKDLLVKAKVGRGDLTQSKAKGRSILNCLI